MYKWLWYDNEVFLCDVNTCQYPIQTINYRTRSEWRIAFSVQCSIAEWLLRELGDRAMFAVEMVTQHQEFVSRMDGRSRGLYTHRHGFPANIKIAEKDGSCIRRRHRWWMTTRGNVCCWVLSNGKGSMFTFSCQGCGVCICNQWEVTIRCKNMTSENLSISMRDKLSIFALPDSLITQTSFVVSPGITIRSVKVIGTQVIES